MKREYNDSERAYALETLANCSGNLSAAARVTGYPRKSIAYWAAQTGVRGSGVGLASMPSPGEQKGSNGSPMRRLGNETDRQEMTERWRTAALLNVEELSNPEKIKSATLRDNTIAAGTAQDKFNILTGGATQRVEAMSIHLVAGGSLRELADHTLRGLRSSDSKDDNESLPSLSVALPETHKNGSPAVDGH